MRRSYAAMTVMLIGTMLVPVGLQSSAAASTATAIQPGTLPPNTSSIQLEQRNDEEYVGALPLEGVSGDDSGFISPQSLLFRAGFESLYDVGFDVYGLGWTQSPYRSSEGSYSAYCAGSLVSAPGPYPNNMATWMIHGPMSLSNQDAVVLSFDLWLDTDSATGSDFLFAGASHDGSGYSGVAWNGNSGGWQHVTVDLSAFSGDPSVWIGFQFVSDGAVSSEGVYIDNVCLTSSNQVRPFGQPDWYRMTQDVPKVVPAPGLLGNDSDGDGDPLTAVMDLDVASGEVVLNSDGSFTFTPDPGFTGETSFYYKAFDGVRSSNLTQVHFEVNPPLPPVAYDDGFYLYQDTSLTMGPAGVQRTDYDPNDDPMTVEWLSTPSNGVAVLRPDGTFDYSPNPGFVGTDSWTYRVEAAGQYSYPATVRVFVQPGSPQMNVYRFYNWRLGTHFYTADENERENVMRTLSGTYLYEGVAYTVNRDKNYRPLYRFYQPSTGTHFYTASQDEKNYVIANLPHIYTFEGTAYFVSPDSLFGSKRTMHRFYNTKTGTHFYTIDEAEKAHVQRNLSHTFTYEGIAFFIGQ